MFIFFILSLLGLCLASVATFIIAFRTKSLWLTAFVPLIATCGSFIYFSYMSVLGYPVQMAWEQLPNKITVIYFRVKAKESITVWLIEKNTTRIIKLPYRKPAEEGLEKGRPKMGKGIPVTYGRSKIAGQDGQGQPGEGENGDGRSGNGIGRSGRRGQGRGGWQYRIESYGAPIPGGSLPPKD